MNDIIKEQLLSALKQLGWNTDIDISISRTKTPEHGDFSSNVAMLLAKELSQPPMKIARQIQGLIDHPDITRVEVASPGFINFFTTRDFSELIQSILDESEGFFAPNVGDNKSIYLEYVSANPTGPLHVGHGRSAAYGSSLANILRRTGFKLHTEYYINDGGLQIDILVTSLWLCMGSKTVPEGLYEGQYLQDCVKSCPKVEINMSDGVDTILENWDKDKDTNHLIELCKASLNDDYDTVKSWIVEHIISGIREDLSAFKVEYDSWFNELDLVQEDRITEVLAKLEEGDHIYEKDGALWFKSSQYGDEKDRVLRRSNGIYTYFANDLAYHQHKCQSGYKTLIDVFGADHHGYVTRIKAGLKALGKEGEFKCILIQFANLFRGEEKVQMSTRSGQFVTLKELYDEVSVDAARFFYCMRNSDNHLDFDLELAKSQNNQNPVYYIQYAHARIHRIFSKHGQYIPTPTHWQQANDLELEILELLSTYPELLEKISWNMEVYRLPQFLLNLATKLHRYYNQCEVLSDDIDIRYHRLLLLHLVKLVIADGLSLLGISAPESM